MIDYYQLLNISPDATEAEIKKAIRQQRAKFRRRVDSSPDIDTRSMAEKKVEQIGEAEKILTDPEKREAYDQQLESAPPDTSADQSTGNGGRDWLAVSREYYRNGDTRKAYSAAKEATDVQSGNVNAWAFRALLASDLDNYDDAEFAIDQGIVTDPENAHLHHIAAVIAYDQEHYGIAIDECQEAFRLDPTDYSDAIQIGWIMGADDRSHEGLEYLKSLHESHPDNIEITTNYVKFALICLESNLSISEGKFPTDAVPTNETQVNIGEAAMSEIESLEVNDDEVNKKRQAYKELLEYAGNRHFEKARIGEAIACIFTWLIIILIINWIFHGFIKFLGIVFVTGIYALIFDIRVFPYGYEMNKEKVGESASATGAQNV